ncbi:MAG: gliding motility-associated lipoprotein GldD [Saprospiraceae bacterium]|jgi:gliding motility-associated lipoprotein GldD
MIKVMVKCFVILILLMVVACDDEVVQPKPPGYYRIDLPTREYQYSNTNCPFEFKVSDQSTLSVSKKNEADCYFDLEYPKFNATVYLSYLPVEGNLKSLVDQEYDLREKHNSFSTGTVERLYKDEQANVSAMMFDVKGVRAATPLQFFITDSVNHFFRGALYFYNSPNNDSLAPVIKYIREDIDTLVATFRWEK